MTSFTLKALESLRTSPGEKRDKNVSMRRAIIIALKDFLQNRVFLP